MAIIFNLFGESVWEGLKSTPTNELKTKLSQKTGSSDTEPAQVVDPCKGCELRDFCSDDCAKHLTPLDVPYNPMTRFRNLGQYIRTLKANGWA